MEDIFHFFFSASCRNIDHLCIHKVSDKSSFVKYFCYNSRIKRLTLFLIYRVSQQGILIILVRVQKPKIHMKFSINGDPILPHAEVQE